MPRRQPSAIVDATPTSTSPSSADETSAEPVAEPPHRDLHAGVRNEERGREEADHAEPDVVLPRGGVRDGADVHEVEPGRERER